MKTSVARLVSILWMLFVCVCALSSPARADTFSFTAYMTYGGNVYGTIDLPFITSSTGSGTGAATSLILTSIGSQFGTLTGGDVITNWADQYANSFTVVNGLVTSELFYAASAASGGDFLCLNTTANTAHSGTAFCQAGVNVLDQPPSEEAYPPPPTPLLR